MCGREEKEWCTCRQTQKWARPMAGPQAAIWSQRKIPTRDKNLIWQIFMTPTQCKEEGQAESLCLALSWYHNVANGGTWRAARAGQGLRQGTGARPVLKAA